MECKVFDTEIERRFREVKEKDSEYIEDWMISWDYQDERKQHVKYPKEYPQKFDVYDGPEDLIKWMNWISKSEFPEIFPPQIVASFLQESSRYDIFWVTRPNNLKLPRKYLDTIARYNAQDYLFQTLYPMPNRNVSKILDFGAGYGRQINLWSQNHSHKLKYVAMDSILNPYCLQNFYYSCSGMPVYEYINYPDGFKIKENGIYHLPTWRCDLLPKKFFDMIICVQVLQEINDKLVFKMIDVFKNVVKSGGILYIRDHGVNWKYSAHKLDIEEMLWDNQFSLEYEPDLIDGEEIHGIPRIWRKN